MSGKLSFTFALIMIIISLAVSAKPLKADTASESVLSTKETTKSNVTTSLIEDLESTTEEETTTALSIESTTFVDTVKEENFTEPPSSFSSLENSMLEAVNLERAKVSKNNVVMCDYLNECARIRAEEIVETFSHVRPDGRTFNTVLTDNGVAFKNWGENVAKGQTSVADVMSDWMNSPGHRNNILSEQYDYTKFGFASKTVDGITYWVQIFISD